MKQDFSEIEFKIAKEQDKFVLTEIIEGKDILSREYKTMESVALDVYTARRGAIGNIESYRFIDIEQKDIDEFSHNLGRLNALRTHRDSLQKNYQKFGKPEKNH